MSTPESVVESFKKRYYSPSSPYREGILFLSLELQEILVAEGVIHHTDELDPDELRKEASRRIKARLKGFDRILDKMQRKEIVAQSIKQIEREVGDIVGTRIVIDYLYEAYSVLRIIANHKRFTVLKTEDYIRNPQPSGYRGIHVTVQLDTPSHKGVVCEIQIKTQTQDSWAEKTHELIYKADQIPRVWSLLAKMQSDCLHHTDEAFELIKEEVVNIEQIQRESKEKTGKESQ